MSRACYRVLPVFVLLVATPVTASQSTIPIVLDAVVFPTGKDSTRVELLAGITAHAPGSTGPLLVSVRVKGEHGRTLAEFERVEPAPPDSMGDRVLSWSFSGKPGKFQARVRLKTLNDPEQDGDADFEMNVPDFSKEPFLVSTPWLLTVPRDSARTPERRIPSRILKGPAEDLAIRLKTLSEDALTARFILRHGAQQLLDSTFTVGGQGGDIEIREDPRRLRGGQYKFQLTLSNGSGSVKREGMFQIAVGGMDLLRDPVLVRTILGYIATGEERLAIETAPVDSLPALWDRFWKRRDPSPDTTTNEALERFLYRVGQATNRFGGVVPGWRSDRGRILIQHGDPKRTERVFDPTTRTETEIWYYDDRNVSYVFQDSEGFGNYRLTGGQ